MIRALKLFRLADRTADADRFLLDAIGHQPDSSTTGSTACGEGRGFLGSHLELSHVIHVVGTHHRLHGPFLALSVDDHSPVGPPERCKAADRLAILADKDPIGTAQQCAVRLECFQCKHRLRSLLAPRLRP